MQLFSTLFHVTFYNSSLTLLLLLSGAASANLRLSTRIVNCISRSCFSRLGVVCSVTQPTTAPFPTSGVYLARSSRLSANRFVLLAQLHSMLPLPIWAEESHIPLQSLLSATHSGSVS